MKYMLLGILLLFTVSSFASELPSGISSCKYQDSYKLISMTEVDFNDNIGNRVDACPREMIYRYSTHGSNKTKILRLDTAKFKKCYYGIIECSLK